MMFALVISVGGALVVVSISLTSEEAELAGLEIDLVTAAGPQDAADSDPPPKDPDDDAVGEALIKMQENLGGGGALNLAVTLGDTQGSKYKDLAAKDLSTAQINDDIKEEILAIKTATVRGGGNPGNPAKDSVGQQLYGAAAIGDIQLAANALNDGADANQPILGVTPLYRASGNGYLDIVKLLVQRGADINLASSEAIRTPLHEAAVRGQIDVVRFLLEQGANVNAKDKTSLTPLGHILSAQLPQNRPENVREISDLLVKFGGTK